MTPSEAMTTPVSELTRKGAPQPPSWLTFNDLRTANVMRCEDSFHRVKGWSPTDWATAMAGECGEACNNIKKLRRLAPTPEEITAEMEDQAYALTNNIADELADVVTYADLLAARLGIDLGRAVREKFNRVSSRVNSRVSL